MGKNTLNYRQSRSSRSGDRGARAYSLINRCGSWCRKVFYGKS